MDKIIEYPSYLIRETDGSPHGDIYELEITTTIDVIRRSDEVIVLSFTGEYSARLGDNGTWDQGSYWGVEKVELTPDERQALVYRTGQDQPERVDLPD